MQKILAMILAGGRVDELNVLTFYRPKSAVPFGGLYRVIDCPLSNLRYSNIENVGILSQYRSYSLINHIGQGGSWDMVGRHRGVTMLPPFQGHKASDWYKGTADAVFQNLDFIDYHKPDLVMVLSGDHIYRMNYQPMIAYHLKKKADLTAAFVAVETREAPRFGLAQIADEDRAGGRILLYQEKPAEPASTWASMTIYLFRPEALREALQENVKSDSHEFGRDIIPAMLGRYKVYGYKHTGYWGYSRKIEEYWQANMDTLGRRPKIVLREWMLRTNLEHQAICDRQPAVIGKTARINNSSFYHGCRIEGQVENSVLFPGVRIAKGAIVKDSVLFFDAAVEEGAFLEKVISDVDVVIGAHTVIGKKNGAAAPQGGITVIGRSTRIPAGMAIGLGCTIYPDLRPEQFTKKEIPSGEAVQ
ncbi:MAG TPA: glucose-1-phosphate adenylyltransferase [Proteobacteria bacterium]|nr:glucose-1-phosphate adenylyltransferase [Pseudomonadota bacterium]